MNTEVDEKKIKNNANLFVQKKALIAFTFFSMFFGAGNLIFAPFLGAQAGTATPLAMVGFIISAVGLPVLGVIAVSTAGGFDQLTGRVSKSFAIVLGLVIMITIGPGFALPRTASTSYDAAIVPFLPDSIPAWLPRLIYSLVFFALAYIIALKPASLTKVIGRFMAPILLTLIAVMFVASLFVHHAAIMQPNGDYAHNQLTQGFFDGYQTMDLIAALYFGIIISANLRNMGVNDPAQNSKEVGFAGLRAGVTLAIVYAMLSFIGVISNSIQPIDVSTATGATVLTNLTTAVFGSFGTALLGLIFVIACFNVCVGLISTCSAYFSEKFPKIGSFTCDYRAWSIIVTVVSFVISNAGLSTIIKVSVPLLVALYPISVVLVILGLLHKVFCSRFEKVYFWTVLFTSIVSVLQCISSFLALASVEITGLNEVLQALPFAQQSFGWLVPAIVGVIIGVVTSVASKKQQ